MGNPEFRACVQVLQSLVPAESPFAFMDEDDRYLIMADLLFDILGELSKRSASQRPAFLRVEDVTPAMEPWLVRELAKTLRRRRSSIRNLNSSSVQRSISRINGSYRRCVQYR
jgi:hypothetical protein